MSFTFNLAHFGKSISKTWLYAFVAVLQKMQVSLGGWGLGDLLAEGKEGSRC